MDIVSALSCCIMELVEANVKENEYPWCSNSRRWLAVEFSLQLPKTCPNESEKECEWEKCAYFSWQEETPYIKKKREIMKSYGMPIISSRKLYESLGEEDKKND